MTSALSTQEREQSGNRAAGWLSVALVMLAVGSATTSVLGPVGLGLDALSHLADHPEPAARQ